MPYVRGRKYQVELDDGTVISRQRLWQMDNPDKRKPYAELTEEEKQERREASKKWREAFKAKHGMSYTTYRYKQRKAHAQEKGL